MFLVNSISAVSAGGDHMCAVIHSADECFGANQYGQLGLGTVSGSPRNPGYSGGTVAALATPTAIAAGPEHSCAAVSSGTIYCWGHNLFGQLGDGTTTNSDIPMPVTGIG